MVKKQRFFTTCMYCLGPLMEGEDLAITPEKIVVHRSCYQKQQDREAAQLRSDKVSQFTRSSKLTSREYGRNESQKQSRHSLWSTLQKMWPSYTFNERTVSLLQLSVSPR